MSGKEGSVELNTLEDFFGDVPDFPVPEGFDYENPDFAGSEELVYEDGGDNNDEDNMTKANMALEGDNDMDHENANSSTKNTARNTTFQQIAAMLQEEGNKLPFDATELSNGHDALDHPPLPLPTISPEKCKCSGELVIDAGKSMEQQVAQCKACHSVPYELSWVTKPPLHTVYKKNLTSVDGYPSVLVTKKFGVKHPFDHLLVTAELINCKDNSIVEENVLEGRTEESKIYHEIGDSTKFEFKKLKIMVTSQQNKSNNFQIMFKLIAQQDTKRMILGFLISSPMNVYSHKNLLPENKNIPSILEIVPRVLPTEGGKICIVCSNIQDPKFLKVKIGDTVIEKIPRRNAPVNAKGIKVYKETLVVDIPANTAEEKVYVVVSNNDKWSKQNKNDIISFRNVGADNGRGEDSLTGSGISLGDVIEVLKKHFHQKEDVQPPSVKASSEQKPSNVSRSPPERSSNINDQDEAKAKRKQERKEKRKLKRMRELGVDGEVGEVDDNEFAISTNSKKQRVANESTN